MQITEKLSRQTYPGHYQTFKIERFTKRIMTESRCASRSFAGQGRFCGTRALCKTFCQTHEKKRPRRETFYIFFSLILLKILSEWKMDINRVFFSKIRALFQFSENDRKLKTNKVLIKFSFWLQLPQSFWSI